MERKRIEAFIGTTVEIIKMWLDEAFMPLVTSAPTPREQLEQRMLSGLPPAFNGPAGMAAMPFLGPNWTPMDFDEEDIDDDIEAQRIIFATMPWGEIVPIPFSHEDWLMVKEISADSGEKISEVIRDIVKERFNMAMYIEGISPPNQDPTDKEE